GVVPRASCPSSRSVTARTLGARGSSCCSQHCPHTRCARANARPRNRTSSSATVSTPFPRPSPHICPHQDHSSINRRADPAPAPESPGGTDKDTRHQRVQGVIPVKLDLVAEHAKHLPQHLDD